MEAKLIIVGGKANKGHVSLKLPTLIGRSRDANLTIAHPMVSRRHCELFEENGLLMIRDLGSLNGTIVRKERITKAEPIRPNEEFTVGPLTFRAEYEYVGEIAGPPMPGKQAKMAAEGQEPPGLFDGEGPPPGENDFAGLDFAVGPSQPQGPELDGLLAGQPPAESGSDDSPPSFDAPPDLELPSTSEPPAFEEEASPPSVPRAGRNDKASGRGADRNGSKQESGASSQPGAPASANGQKPTAPKQFSEEDLDEFFKDAI